jgi:iron(III) transport system ATP-binding protein
MTKTEPYLKVINVTKKFGEFIALKDVTIDIFEGEFVCFLGPSGCGKTTLLRAISGLDIQTYGQIYQLDKDISALPPSERDFGIVFQSYALFPNLTVFRNVAYGLENRKVPKSTVNKKVAELLELVGLSDQGKKYPAQLSGGQQQRVALARAIATSPGLLLLDEPLSALDAKVRVHLRNEIKQLQQRLGVTTIMVTHDQEEALTMADRIVVINKGLVEQVGTPLEIYREPATPFVADFIGRMNFMEGEVQGKNRVRLGKKEIDCRTNGHTAGMNVRLAIRPEDIVVMNVQEETPNSFEVEVRALEFLGSHFRAELGGENLNGGRLHGEFSMNLMRRLSLDHGSRFMIQLPAEQLHLFPLEN